MVNDCFLTGKILPGDKGLGRFLPSRRRARAPWERRAVRQDAKIAWEGELSVAILGSLTDGERVSRRTVAPDRAPARTGRGRQQHREPEHNRLQGGQRRLP